MQSSSVIYLDNNATTKIDPRVLEAMLPFLTDNYANASSTHAFGTRVQKAVKEARNQIADLIGCDSAEIVFSSGATEAINLGLKGIAESHKQKGKHIITTVTEHSATLDTCRYLESIGFEVTYLAVKNDGLLNLEELKKSIRKDTILVSVIYANNEIGVIQPIAEVAKITHANGALFMTDGTQAVGKVPIDVMDLGIDLMSFSAHKFYGPKGVGALYVRNKNRLSPLIHGGGQEGGLRSGTINSPSIIGFGKAAKIAKEEIETDMGKIKAMRDYLEVELLKIESSYLNGHLSKRIYNTSNICFQGLDADTLIARTQNIAMSNGSACSSTSIEPSHVLNAIGLSKEDAFSSIRFSLGKFNTMDEISLVVREIARSITNLRVSINEK